MALNVPLDMVAVRGRLKDSVVPEKVRVPPVVNVRVSVEMAAVVAALMVRAAPATAVIDTTVPVAMPVPVTTCPTAAYRLLELRVTVVEPEEALAVCVKAWKVSVALDMAAVAGLLRVSAVPEHASTVVPSATPEPETR